jgi:hypothetical protein
MLLNELFRPPIEIQHLMPDYVMKLPPGYLAHIEGQLNQLKKRVNEMLILRDKVVYVTVALQRCQYKTTDALLHRR